MGRVRQSGHWRALAETGDDTIDIVEVEGAVEMSIRLRGRRFGVVRYHHDDDEGGAVGRCGRFETPGEAVGRVAPAR